MSDQNSTPSETAKDQEKGVIDTFPASDPVAQHSTNGSRAVHPQDMMHAADSEVRDGSEAQVAAHFDSVEDAKLAVEDVVRSGPIDRRRTEIIKDADGATVEVHALPEDADRVTDLLHKDGGKDV